MKKVIKTFELRQSRPPRTSRAADPYDNAWAESFWMGPPSGRMKAELDMSKGGYDSIEMLKSMVFDYIDGYYNITGLHCVSSPVVLKLFKSRSFRGGLLPTSRMRIEIKNLSIKPKRSHVNGPLLSVWKFGDISEIKGKFYFNYK